MSVTLERCRGDAFVARAGPDHYQHGDPYELACTIECSGTLATVKGLATDSLTRDLVRELSALLREEGFTALRIERSKDGRMTEQTWDIQ